MKKFIYGITAFVLIAGGCIFIFGRNGEGERRGPGGWGGFGEHGLLRMAGKLNMTEEQKTKVKQITEDSKTRVAPLIEALRDNHRQVEKLGADGVYNAEQVEQAAAARADLTRQMVIEKEKTKAAIFAVLTPEQRTRAAELKDRFRDRFKKRGDRQNGPESSEE